MTPRSAFAAAPFWRRLLAFTVMPTLGAVSPLIVLPVVARVAGTSGWANAMAGESIGTLAAVLLAYGWTSIGPSLVASAHDEAERRSLYRDSLAVRLALALVVIPLLAAVSLFAATPGYAVLTFLMGLQGCLVSLSFAWFAVGDADPGAIVRYDAIPRVTVAILSAGIVSMTGAVEVYPLGGIMVTLLGTALYTRRRFGSRLGWIRQLRHLPMLLRLTTAVAVNDTALSVYSSIPTPLVNFSASASLAAGFASGDKMVKLGQYIPITLGNALQSWTVEAGVGARARRVRLALVAHGALGLFGLAGLATLGPWVSAILFGAAASADRTVLVLLGVVFACFSLRTSLQRHLLFPLGATRAVLYATVAGSVIGIPLMVVLSQTLGPIGAAFGYAVSEATSTVLLVVPASRGLRELDKMASWEGVY